MEIHTHTHRYIRRSLYIETHIKKRTCMGINGGAYIQKHADIPWIHTMEPIYRHPHTQRYTHTHTNTQTQIYETWTEKQERKKKRKSTHNQRPLLLCTPLISLALKKEKKNSQSFKMSDFLSILQTLK